MLYAPKPLHDPRVQSFSRAALFLLCSISTAQAQSEEPSLPVFENGQAQVVKAFSDAEEWIQEDLWVETEFDSDGDGQLDRMHMDVTRPVQTQSEGLKVAVIFESSPYYSGVSSGDSAFMWDPHQELGGMPPFRENPPPIKQQDRRLPISQGLIRTWVPRGFAVVHSEGPGTGLSQGCPTVGAANEALAPKAIVDWLNGRAAGYTSAEGDERISADWCTGKVGMTGTSYNGMLPILCATTGVEGLAAIIPVSAPTSFYNYYRANGLVRHPGGYMGEDVDVLYDFIHSGELDTREYCNSRIRDEIMLDGFDRSNGDYNDFWAERDYSKRLDTYTTPTFLAHGLNDWNVAASHSVDLYASLKAKGIPARLYLHQRGHGGPPPMAEMNRWFSHYLYGVENGVEQDARSLVMREGVKFSEGPTAYADYPHPDSQTVLLHLSQGGEKRGGLSLRDEDTDVQESLVDDVQFSGAELAQASSSKNRLIYALGELKEELHLSGTARVNLTLSSSKPAANLSVWLVSLPWEPGGTENSNLISRGWADPQNHASIKRGEPLTPGKSVSVGFALEPDDQIIPAGQSIGLMIFSSDREFTLWPEAGTKLTFNLSECSLELPVVGGAKTLRASLGRMR